MKPALKNTLWTLLSVALAAAVIAPKVISHSSAATEAKPAAAGGAGKPVVPRREGGGSASASSGGNTLTVSTFVVTPQQFAEKLTATGTLRADEAVELQAETTGKIVSINFTEGARVRAGQLLVKLNDADLRATLSRAQYRKQLAVLREKRIAQLLKQGVARQEEYDTALAELNVQDADIELTRAQIAKTEIRAPFDGIVGLRYVSDGAFITAATKVATLQRLDRLKIDFSLPEKYAGRINPRSPVTFSVAGGERRFKGEVYAQDPRIDAATRTVLVRAWCDNPGARLLPGASASVELVLAELGEAILVPSVAVIPGLNELNVYVVGEGNMAERRAVEAGTRLESTVHILAGLNKGDVVITSGLQGMRSGQLVRTASE
ncbi:MAG TPA: efflux RND transporter periplasmic adaptor subunit [Steroidobacteraceae bacterium]|nr:efflux RND transporter periplasmic adaptor subunit [Steroidobacteraceae bacterium]